MWPLFFSFSWFGFVYLTYCSMPLIITCSISPPQLTTVLHNNFVHKKIQKIHHLFVLKEWAYHINIDNYIWSFINTKFWFFEKKFDWKSFFLFCSLFLYICNFFVPYKVLRFFYIWGTAFHFVNFFLLLNIVLNFSSVEIISMNSENNMGYFLLKNKFICYFRNKYKLLGKFRYLSASVTKVDTL